MTETPLPETAIIPVLPADLQQKCGEVIPRLGIDGRVEMWRALDVLDLCAERKDGVTEFYNKIRAAQLAHTVTQGEVP